MPGKIIDPADGIKDAALETLKKEVCGLVATAQSEMKARGAIDETVNALTAKAAELTESYQTIQESLITEKKIREELEAKIARVNIMPRTQDGEAKLSSEDAMKQFVRFVKTNVHPDKEIIAKEVDAMVDFYVPYATDHEKAMIKTLTVGSESNVGVIAPIDVIRGITKRVFETSPMEQFATVITTTREAVPWIISDEFIGSLKRGEFEPVTETGTPGLAIKQIHVHERIAQPKISSQLLEDGAFALESWITGMVSDEFSRQKNREGVVGTGNGEAQGFMTLDPWTDAETYERGRIGSIVTGGVGKFEYADFIDVYKHLLEKYQPGAAFWTHRISWAEVMKLLDGYDRPLINPQAFFEGARPQILGQPVILASDMAIPDAVGTYTTGQKPVAYANMREGYLIVNRIGMSVIRDEITEPRFVKWTWAIRSGGAVKDYQAIKYMIIQ